MKYIAICGTVGAGKTTLLRACIRALSESGQRVSVCDDRGEISAMTQGTAQFDLGPQTDILTGLSKDEGMLLLLRAMNCRRRNYGAPGLSCDGNHQLLRGQAPCHGARKG